MTTDIEEANVLAGLTKEEAALSAGEEPANINQDEEAPVDELRSDPAPILIAKPVEGARELASRLAAWEDDLALKFDEGDITAREYREGLAQVAAHREELNWNARKVELAHEMKTQAETAAWHREVQNFMTKGPGASIAQSRSQMVAFDEHVRAVTADPANARLSDRAQLQKAFAAYKRDMASAGITVAEGGLEAAYALGGIGGGSGRSGDYGALDRLIDSGRVDDIERSLGRMSKDERDRFGL